MGINLKKERFQSIGWSACRARRGGSLKEVRFQTIDWMPAEAGREYKHDKKNF